MIENPVTTRMKKSLLLLLLMNSFFITAFIIITWQNIYITNSTIISTANYTLNLLLELSILNSILLIAGIWLHWKPAKILFISILSTYFLIFIIQALSIKISGYPLVVAALYNIKETPLLINRQTLTTAFLTISLFILLLYFLTRNSFSGKLAFIYICILAIAYPLALKYKHSDTFKYYIEQAQKHQYSPPASPFRNFFKVAKLYLQEREINTASQPTKEDLEIASRFNLTVNPEDYYPFLKKQIYDQELENIASKASDKPNVIVFFIESLSARLLGAYGNPHEGLTPNIDEFAQSSTVVTGYYNHTTPTMPALFGQHCSLYPLITGKQMKGKNNPIAKPGTKCYPQYFREAGYETIYFSHTKPGKWHIHQNLGIWGYEKRYFWQNLLNNFLEKEKLGLYFSGVSDHQMMRSVIVFMKNHTQEKPFLLGVSTIETHVGFKLSKDGVQYAQGDNNVLNMIHNFDHAFGLFWKYFKHSKYASNTIIILTGDHVPYQSRDYMEVVGKNWKPSVFDEMSLIIYDPLHLLPDTKYINATSVDLAPTLMQLANINPRQKNAFLGKALFDSRPFDAAFGISPYPDYNVFFSTGNRLVNEVPSKIRNMEDKKTILSLHRILKYSEYLRQHGRFYPTNDSDTTASTQGIH
jgi:phosphoglycerol transferase MdoB-like AlkP superfamily enzyme